MNKKLLLVPVVVLFSACSTVVPLKAGFPDAPSQFFTSCPTLKQLEASPKLSDVSKTVAENYTTYYECSIKNDAWIEWYKNQRKIIESVK